MKILLFLLFPLLSFSQLRIDSFSFFAYSSPVKLIQHTEKLVLLENGSFEYVCNYCGYGMIPYYSFGEWKIKQNKLILNSSFKKIDSCYITEIKTIESDSFNVKFKTSISNLSYLNSGPQPIIFPTVILNEKDTVSLKFPEGTWEHPSSNTIKTIRVLSCKTNTTSLNLSNTNYTLEIEIKHVDSFYKIFDNETMKMKGNTIHYKGLKLNRRTSH